MSTESQFLATFLYPKTGLSRFDLNYYLKNHIPSTQAAWGPLGMVNIVTCNTEENDEYRLMVITSWKNRAAWDTAQNDKSAQSLVADIQNFTNVTPSVVFGGVLR